jgi:hypothetical protein
MSICFPLSALIISICCGNPAKAQSVPSQGPQITATPSPNQDNDTTRGELARFDQFLDGHHEISEQLRKDPSLVNNDRFVKDHPELQSYLKDHPGIREEIKENPNAFMRQESRFDRNEDKSGKDMDASRSELQHFDGFLDGHREISEQLRKDPSLVNNERFVKDHPALQAYLHDHPGVRDQIKQDPNAFMQQENRFDRVEDKRGNDVDASRAELQHFNEFLDSHREIAEQVRKNPRVMNNEAFVENHPALLAYLQEHPEVRQQIKQNPTSFMQAENKFDHREDGLSRDKDANRAEHERFDQFLDSHREIAEQVRKNPSLVDNQEFSKNHPELQAYLQEHPGVRDDIRENPNGFMRQQNNFDRHDEVAGRDVDRDRSRSFGEFLGSHRDVANELSRDPSQAKNREFIEHHPELQDYLKNHPDVNQELMKNPQGFVKSAQLPNSENPGVKPPALDPTKPNH